MDFSICGILGQFFGAIQSDIEKRFAAPLMGVKIKSLKILAFKIFIFILSQICNFAKFSKKSCFIIFIDVWPLPYQWYTVIFSFLTM